MNSEEFVDRQLGRAAQLISSADREWLVREAILVERVSQTLAEMEKGVFDFAPIHRVIPPASDSGA